MPLQQVNNKKVENKLNSSLELKKAFAVGKNQTFGKIKWMNIILQWMLVQLLSKYTENNKGNGLIRKHFLEYALKKKRLFLFRDIPYLRNDDKFQTRVNFALGDCIRGDAGYMDENRDSVILANKDTDLDGKNPVYDNPLLVTAKGRKFISFWFVGLLEELTKSYPRAIGIIITSGFIWYFVDYIIDWFISDFLI